MKTTSATIDPHPPKGEWKARPALAWCIRAATVLVPLVVSWLGVRFAMRFVARPAGIGPMVLWFIGAIALSMLLHLLARRLMRRFSSLGVLLNLSLTFPAAAPSRMRAFLRGGTNDGRTEDASTGLVDLVTKISRRDGRIGRHGDRVGGYAALIGKELRLSDDEIQRLRWAALVHDVGMLDVHGRIRDSRSELSAADRTSAEQHTKHASGYLAPFAEWLGEAAKVAAEHHERWDGTGYPAGLAGDDISLAARIITVADAYDAMTASRFYKRPIPAAAARRELVDNAGDQFDPTVVRAFLNAGIEKSNAELGSVGAVIEFASQVAKVGSAAGSGAATAGIGLATAAAVVTTAVVVPAISTSVEANDARVERIVEEVPEPEVSEPAPEERVPRSSTTRRPATTSTTASTTSTTTTTTTTSVPVTMTTPPTTIPPLPPPTTTTTPLPVATTTTVALPAYPTVAPPTTTAVTYPTVGT